MLKRGSIRRIIVASFALFLVVLAIYLFPQDEVKVPLEIIYKKADTSAIYLIDKNNYVSRTKINVKNKEDREKLAKELLEALINSSEKNKYLPDGFKSYINNNVKINNIKIENDLIEVDFTGLFDNLEKQHEEKIIESITYTLTEINGIDKVIILINGEKLTRLPQSGKVLPDVLTRKIGINKISKLNGLKNTQDITTYFISKDRKNPYFIPVTLTTSESDEEKIEIIIKELQGKDIIDDNLCTYIAAGTYLKNYQILESEINIEFNNAIFNGFNKIDEEVMYGISLSVYDTYNIRQVNFFVNDKKIDAYVLKTT